MERAGIVEIDKSQRELLSTLVALLKLFNEYPKFKKGVELSYTGIVRAIFVNFGFDPPYSDEVFDELGEAWIDVSNKEM